MNTVLDECDYNWEELVRKWEYNPLSDIIMKDVVLPIQQAIQNIPDNYDQERYFRYGLGYSATTARVFYLITCLKSKEELLEFLICCIVHTYEYSRYDMNFDSEDVSMLCSLAPSGIYEKFPLNYPMSSPFSNYAFTYVDFKTVGGNMLVGSEYPVQIDCMIEKMSIDMLCTMHKLSPSFIKSCNKFN